MCDREPEPVSGPSSQLPGTQSSQLASTQNSQLPATQNSQPPASQNSQKSSQPVDKVWKLKGGSMRVVGHGKKKPTDLYMILQLEFSFDNEPRPRKVGNVLTELKCSFFKYFIFGMKMTF